MIKLLEKELRVLYQYIAIGNYLLIFITSLISTTIFASNSLAFFGHTGVVKLISWEK